MTKYKALTRIRHDGDDYLPGEILDLDEKNAKGLLSVRAVEEAKLEVPMDAAGRARAIEEAIRSLDREDADLWLQDGKPDLVAIQAALGWSPSAGERDAAWKAVQG